MLPGCASAATPPISHSLASLTPAPPQRTPSVRPVDANEPHPVADQHLLLNLLEQRSHHAQQAALQRLLVRAGRPPPSASTLTRTKLAWAAITCPTAAVVLHAGGAADGRGGGRMLLPLPLLVPPESWNDRCLVCAVPWCRPSELQVACSALRGSAAAARGSGGGGGGAAAVSERRSVCNTI